MVVDYAWNSKPEVVPDAWVCEIPAVRRVARRKATAKAAIIFMKLEHAR